MDTYFTFPDGGLRYDCAACRQRCCRGKGIALGPDELVPLLSRAPRLGAFLRLRAGGTLGATNLSDGCWLHKEDGLCAVEVQHGRAAKPATCRLFPFNRVYRVGAVRVVDVNSVLCPVSAAGGAGVRHGELLAEIEALTGSPLLDVPATEPQGLPGDWLARERTVSEAALGADPATVAAAGGDAEAEALAPGWARLLDLDPAARASAEAQVASDWALILPSLRWDRLFRRPAAPYDDLARRLPRRARALLLLGAAATLAQGRVPSIRGLTELWQGLSALLDVLERWTEPVRLTTPHFDADLPPLLRPALGVLLAGAFRGGRTLGELVEAAAGTLPPGQRPLALALAASQLSTLLSG